MAVRISIARIALGVVALIVVGFLLTGRSAPPLPSERSRPGVVLRPPVATAPQRSSQVSRPQETALGEDVFHRPEGTGAVTLWARGTGRRFVAALLLWERGRTGARGRVRRNASRPLAARIMSRRPRPTLAGARPLPGHLVRLFPVSASRRLVTLAATVDRAGRRSGLLLTLQRHGHRWRVEAMR